MTTVPFSNSIELNKTLIRCPFPKCNTRLLKPKTTEIFKLNVSGLDFLQAVKPTSIENDVDTTSDNDEEQFIKISDVWDFDNIGVSKEFPDDITTSIGSKIERLIICSDCERGPLGFACFENLNQDVKDVKDLTYYLCLSSVVFE